MIQRLSFFTLILVSAFSVKAQVSLQTGAAQFSLPLYNYSDPNNRLATGISLVYTAGSGLKVDEIPSSVGAGWKLECGGFIQRIQHGEPDDQKNNDTYSYPATINTVAEDLAFKNWVLNYYPNGYLYSEFSPLTPITNGATYTPMSHNPLAVYKPHQKYQADLEQDIFMFSFNGKSGYFLIGKKDVNNVNPIRTLYELETEN